MKHKALLGLSLFFLIVFSACESGSVLTVEVEDEEKVCIEQIVRLTGAELGPYDRFRDVDGRLHIVFGDTVRHQLGMEVWAVYDVVERREVECVTDPLADPLLGEIMNPVRLPHTVQFNKVLYVNDQLISARRNLLEMDELKDDYSLRPRVSPFAIFNADFSRDTFRMLRGWYQVLFEWETVEGEVLSDTVRVYMDQR